MKAFHGDAAIQARYIARIEAHYLADDGKYGFWRAAAAQLIELLGYAPVRTGRTWRGVGMINVR